MSEELKPCPFCGSKDSVEMRDGIYWPGVTQYKVTCFECGASADNWGTTTQAIEAWNVRA